MLDVGGEVGIQPEDRPVGRGIMSRTTRVPTPARRLSARWRGRPGASPGRYTVRVVDDAGQSDARELTVDVVP